jgi:MYXO-CTERM domain-containing protein
MALPARLALVVLSALLPATAHAATYVDDPLTSDSHPGRGSKGGTFSASGWTTTSSPTASDQDAIWYEIPDALPNGSVQVTVSGLEIGTTLAGADHDLLVLYQAPSGHPEPAVYSPYFRDNDFKTFIRIFGSLEVQRPGATKLELAFCPRGDPWYHSYACDPGCDQGGIAYGGNGQDIGWDAGTEYTLRLEWGAGAMSLFRNGTKLGQVSFTGSWAPQPLRVRIGTPRNDGIYPGEVYMPPGLTFKNMLVEGTAGARTPACGEPAVDAGAGGSGGAPPADAGATTTEYAVLQDVTAAAWESGVFPDVDDLNVSGGSPSEVGIAYLRFPPIAGTVDKAILRLRAHAFASAEGGSGIICRVDDDSWQETTMTWATRPEVSTQCAGTSRTIDPDTDVEWDVTPLVGGGGNVNLAIVSDDLNGAHLLSKEGAAGAPTGPTLIVVASPSSGTGGGAASGGANSGGSGWSDGGSLGGSSGKPAAGNADGDDSGCGCRTPATRTGSALSALLLGLGLLIVRRQRRR